MIGFIKRNSSKGMSSMALKYLHIYSVALVRSRISYCTQVFGPMESTLHNPMQNQVQRGATKFICTVSTLWDWLQETTCSVIKLLPFSYWLEYLVIQMY
jgi:hypothetical protein